MLIDGETKDDLDDDDLDMAEGARHQTGAGHQTGTDAATAADSSAPDKKKKAVRLAAAGALVLTWSGMMLSTSRLHVLFGLSPELMLIWGTALPAQYRCCPSLSCCPQLPTDAIAQWSRLVQSTSSTARCIGFLSRADADMGNSTGWHLLGGTYDLQPPTQAN